MNIYTLAYIILSYKTQGEKLWKPEHVGKY